MTTRRALAVLSSLIAVIFCVALAAVAETTARTSEQTVKNSGKGVHEIDDSFTLIATREINASVDQVWAAWHDPKKIAQWWGPAGFQSTVKKLDVRPGGRFEVVMHGPDGVDYPNVYIFEQIQEKKQLIYTNVGSERFGLAPFQSVFDLESVGNKTRVVLKARFISEEDKRKHVEEFHAIEGSRQLLQRLEEQAR